MRSQDRWRNVDRGERGSATLEFVVAAVVLIVPVALFSAVMSQVFSVAMAAQRNHHNARGISCGTTFFLVSASAWAVLISRRRLRAKPLIAICLSGVSSFPRP